MTDTFAVVFPGQGSQSVGMLGDLAGRYPQIQQTYDEASATLGYDLWQVVQLGPEADLNSTRTTQPALLAGSVAIWRVMQAELDASPAVLAGHSLGEYSALVCAGALGFSDAISLVEKRGTYMQAAVAPGEGSMAAILGLDDDDVVQICADISGDLIVSAANFNSPGQVVIAGNRPAVEAAVEAAKSAGARRPVILPVSVPSHCALMRPAAERLQQDLEGLEIRPPAIPVLHNVDAESRTDAAAIRTALVEQLYAPVQWTRCVRAMSAYQVKNVFECGPGKVLSGLIRRIDRELGCLSSSELVVLQKSLSILRGDEV